jgi:disulfide oxidoreductase YuzD
MSTKYKINWHNKPAEHNYPAALSYLSLLFEPAVAKGMVHKLKLTQMAEFKAKDIFRASNLSLLGVSNKHVRRNEKKIKHGEKLTPILLVRQHGHRVIVADGYHRMCAVYHYDEDAVIPCKII